ncbi:hypothetical protein P7H20_16560 [Paenibacillus larvae]|nr:hypothetical protein [Paenibacillus larvae]MDT2276115.1 hypothetical protein [Paenibacillus larvae]
MHRETIKKLNETITSLCDYIQDLIERNPADAIGALPSLVEALAKITEVEVLDQALGKQLELFSATGAHINDASLQMILLKNVLEER